jgi:hypothetical protein
LLMLLAARFEPVPQPPALPLLLASLLLLV